MSVCSSTATSLAEEFAHLAVSHNLRAGSKQYRQAQNKFIVAEFEAYFGEASNLQNWQKMCYDLGIERPLPSISQCRKALKNVWVNIWDFLTAVRNGERVKIWETERALAEYTRRERKFYPKAKAKQSGPVSALLAHVF